MSISNLLSNGSGKKIDKWMKGKKEGKEGQREEGKRKENQNNGAKYK